MSAIPPTRSLRTLDPDRDGTALHAVFGDPESMRFMHRPACDSVASTTRLLSDWGRDPASPQWAVLERTTVVGRVTLVQAPDASYEIGIQVVPEARGRRVARDAIVLATRHGFDRLAARRILAVVDVRNRSCRRALAAAGFLPSGRRVVEAMGRNFECVDFDAVSG